MTTSTRSFCSTSMTMCSAFSAHELLGPDDYLPLIAGLPQTSAPGEGFAYNNSGYIMLSPGDRASGRRQLP